MSHRVLLTGASGYLGGSLLERWSSANLPQYEKLFALVRTAEQASAVKQYGAIPLEFDVKDEAAVVEAITSNQITIVLFLIDAVKAESQVYFMKALAEVKRMSGLDVHLVHTSGAKLFSSHAGSSVNRPLLDTEDLYRIQKEQKPSIPLTQPAIDANNTIIEQGELLGVWTYIFIPCIVYGKGTGFGNKISFQTVAIVKAALAAKRVYDVNSPGAVWPVCDIVDNTNLYLQLIRSILVGDTPKNGRLGYYLAASGEVPWAEIYAAFAAALAKHGVVEDATVMPATDEDLKRMALGLNCPKELVALQLGGTCTLTARNGEMVGWKPHHKPSHILETAAEEVDLILENLRS